MALEAMTEGFRTQVQRAGDAWLRQGRVVGAKALRKGARTLTRTAAPDRTMIARPRNAHLATWWYRAGVMLSRSAIRSRIRERMA